MRILKNIQDTYANYGSWREMVNDLGYQGLVKNLGFIAYCVVLLLVCISLIHRNENRIRSLVDTNKKLREKTWEFKDEKRKLMFLTKESELITKVKDMGLEATIELPKRIIVKPTAQ